VPPCVDFNAGPELNQIYRKALLVLWPRSQAIANAKRAGIAALLALLKRRLTEAANLQQQQQQQRDAAAPGHSISSSSSSSTARFGEVAAEVADVLRAAVAVQSSQRYQPTNYRSYNANSGG
jgi:hypothetical protein